MAADEVDRPQRRKRECRANEAARLIKRPSCEPN
jgi:hypothetical protein